MRSWPPRSGASASTAASTTTSCSVHGATSTSMASCPTRWAATPTVTASSRRRRSTGPAAGSLRPSSGPAPPEGSCQAAAFRSGSRSRRSSRSQRGVGGLTATTQRLVVPWLLLVGADGAVKVRRRPLPKGELAESVLDLAGIPLQGEATPFRPEVVMEALLASSAVPVAFAARAAVRGRSPRGGPADRLARVLRGLRGRWRLRQRTPGAGRRSRGGGRGHGAAPDHVLPGRPRAASSRAAAGPARAGGQRPPHPRKSAAALRQPPLLGAERRARPRDPLTRLEPDHPAAAARLRLRRGRGGRDPRDSRPPGGSTSARARRGGPCRRRRPPTAPASGGRSPPVSTG